MTFTQLLALVQSKGLRVCADSRKLQPGDVFVAVCGTQVDGHDYIDKAFVFFDFDKSKITKLVHQSFDLGHQFLVFFRLPSFG